MAVLQHPAESGLPARLHPLAAHAGEVLLQRALPQPRHAQAAVRLGPAADRPVRRVPAVRSRGQYRAHPPAENIYADGKYLLLSSASSAAGSRTAWACARAGWAAW